MGMFTLRVLGTAALEEEGGERGPGRAGQPRPLALLAVLALGGEDGWSRDQLVGLFWPEEEDRRARHNLSDLLYLVRRELGEDAVFAEGDRVHLGRERVRADVDEFEALLEAGELAAAVEAYRGPLLEGFYLRGAPPAFEHWLDAERRRLRTRYISALEALSEDAEDSGEWRQATRRWKKLVSEEPLNTRYVLGFIRTAVASGDPASAVRQARVHMERLETEMELPPPPELLEALADIRRSDRAPGVDAPREPERSASKPAEPDPSGAAALDGASIGPRPRDATSPSEDRGRELSSPRTASLWMVGGLTLGGLFVAGWLLFRGATPGDLEQGALPGADRGGDATVAVAPELLPPEETHRASVAVLPFRNMGAPDDLFLSEGMTEEVTDQLTQVPDLKVISRTSVMTLRGAGLTLPQIADTLGVEHILEGGVRFVEDSARITVRLVEAASDASLWSQSYTRELSALFEVQEEIARRVVQALTSTVLDPAAPSPTVRPTDAAYEAYLKGRLHLRQWTSTSLGAAREAFQRAYGLAPDYAPAYEGHASALANWVLLRYSGEVDHYQAFGRALALVDRTLELGPGNATAHSLSGLVRNFAWAPDEVVRRSFRRALELQPSSAEIQGRYALFLLRSGAVERALAWSRRSLELDPLAPARRVTDAVVALGARDYQRALQQARRALLIQPELPSGRYVIAVTLLLQGRPDGCLDTNLTRGLVMLRAACLHSAGRPDEARAIVDEEIDAVEGRAPDVNRPDAYQALAIYHAWTGDVEGALHWMDRAWTASPAGVDLWYIRSGLFDRVRGDPRFQQRWEEIRAEVWDRVRSAAAVERERLAEEVAVRLDTSRSPG